MNKVEVSGDNFKKCLSITNQIDYLLFTIHNDTAGRSTHLHIVIHPDFHTLVGMGVRIIPYLIHHAMENGWHWIHMLLLRKITEQDPVKREDAGHFLRGVHAWIGWYLDSGLDDHDVYYNLLND